MDGWLGSSNEAEYAGGDTTVHLDVASEGDFEGDGWIEVAGERESVRYRLVEEGGIVFMRSGSRYHLTSLVQPLCSSRGLVTSAEYSGIRLARKSST